MSCPAGRPDFRTCRKCKRNSTGAFPIHHPIHVRGGRAKNISRGAQRVPRRAAGSPAPSPCASGTCPGHCRWREHQQQAGEMKKTPNTIFCTPGRMLLHRHSAHRSFLLAENHTTNVFKLIAFPSRLSLSRQFRSQAYLTAKQHLSDSDFPGQILLSSLPRGKARPCLLCWQIAMGKPSPEPEPLHWGSVALIFPPSSAPGGERSSVLHQGILQDIVSIGKLTAEP